MEWTPKGIYTPEFRAEAVKLVETTGMSVERAAKQLSMPKSSLDNWVRAAREGKLAEVGKGQRLPSELELRDGSANLGNWLSEISASMGDGNRLPRSRSNEKTSS